MRNDYPCAFLLVKDARCLDYELEEKDKEIQAENVAF
jgi:hypothetical protein